MAHKIGRSIKKEVLDDALGIDENKTFGIKNKTFLGKTMSKVTPGAKNNIWGQAGDFIEDKVTQPVKEGVGALGALVTGKTAAQKAAAAQQAQLDAYNAQVSSLEKKENEANRMALASTLLSRGKGKFFDITRPESVEKFLLEQEGDYLDPFPDYLRQSGDYLLGDLENTAENINNYIGTPDERMAAFQPTLDRLGGLNQNAIDTLASIYDGRMESELGGYKDQAQGITRQLQGLNTEAGDITAGLQGNVLNRAGDYANSLGDSVDMETALANRRFDVLDTIPDLIRAANSEVSDRYGNTFESQLRGAGQLFDAEMDSAGGIYGAEADSAGGIFDAQNRAADMIERAERAKALAAGANAENLANQQQRGIRSGMVGQGMGTAQNMGNAMIRAQLGQQRSDLLADTLIRDAERRGNADIDYATSMGGAGIDYSGSVGDAGIGYAGTIGDAGTEFSQKLEEVLNTDADMARAKIGAERFETLGDINPAMADVYRNEAMMGRANTALGFGDPRLQARAENLGLDQSIVDSDQGFFSSMMAQQLANTGMIPGLGMQEAMLPAMMGEAALAPQGPMARVISPYTSTGTLPQGQTVFQSAPYSPAPIAEGRRDWLDILSDVPGYIQKGQDAYGKIKGIFS